MSADKVEKLGDAITCHAWNGDRTKVALCLNSNDVLIYKYSGGSYALEHTLTGHDSVVTGIDWAPSTNRIVTCGQDRNAYVFDFDGREWKPTLVILRLDRAATCVKWSPKEDKFGVGTGSKAISICYYDLENTWWVSKHIREIKAGITSTIKCLSWHPNNVIIAAGGTDNKVHVFSTFTKGIDSRTDVSGGTAFGSKLPWAKVLAEFPTTGWIHDIAFSPSGNQLAWVTHDAVVSFLDCASENHRVQTVKSSGLPFQTILWAGESTLIAAGHDANPGVYQGGAMNYSYRGPLNKGKAAGAGGNTSAAQLWQQRAGKGTTDSAELDSKLQTDHQNAITQVRPLSATQFSTVGNDGQIAIWTYSKVGVTIQ